MSESDISLISVVGGSVEVLPHMLKHYREIGIGRILLHVNLSSDLDPAYEIIAKSANCYDAKIVSRSIGPWWAAMNTVQYMHHRSIRPNDWYVIADCDELQRYPDGLLETVAHCSKHNYDYVEGCLIDRIAVDGALRRIQENTSLWDQFPLGAFLSAVINKSVVNKIVAVKGHVRLTHGQHQALSGRGCPIEEIYVPTHHFKWTHDLQSRLNSRITIPKFMNGAYHEECLRVLSYITEDLKIPFDDSRLLIGLCNPEYPFWQRIKELRCSVKYFISN